MTGTSIALVSMNAMLALGAATILRKRWMRYFALVCAAVEVAAVAYMIATART
jgi:hypothetical protein